MGKRKTTKYKTGRVLVGSCLDRLKEMPDASIDSIVTDPPYELGFMGKSWDASGIAYSIDLWREALRVLKPGGHLLAFGGTRTYHRMAVAIEDAGFEIRDSLHWVYGSGFPKSLDVSKAIDKQRHDRNDVYKVTAWVRETRDAAGITNKDIDKAFGFAGMAGHWTSQNSQPAVPTLDQVPQLLDLLGVDADDVPTDVRHLLWDLNGCAGEPGKNWAKREVVGTADSTVLAVAPGEGRKRPSVTINITAPATDAAQAWQGWGTALKPAHEPIVLARKPLTGTVAANVLEHGTGALNIDGCRIGEGTGETITYEVADIRGGNFGQDVEAYAEREKLTYTRVDKGRWPANVIFDEAAGAELDAQSGVSGGGQRRDNVARTRNNGLGLGTTEQRQGTANSPDNYGDTGGASRFFYCPKPGKRERNAGLDKLPLRRGGAEQLDSRWKEGTGEDRQPMNQNIHPTVKPVELMRYLCRLITPPGGVVLDPFLGSGTTAVAAILEGLEWVGCEMTEDYLPIIKGRVQWAQRQQRPLL